MLSLQPKNTFLFPLDILLWARLCSCWNYFRVSVAMRQRRSIHTGAFPCGCNSFSQREKTGKMHFSFLERWSFVSRRIKLPSSPQVSFFHSKEKCAVLSREDPGLSYGKLGKSSWQVSPCTFWVSSVSCLGTSATKEQSVFPEGRESATWLLVSWSTGCL